VILQILDHDVGGNWSKSGKQLAEQFLSGSETVAVSMDLDKLLTLQVEEDLSPKIAPRLQRRQDGARI
jgi:hypothetical protein